MMNTKKCLICKGHKANGGNECLHWHNDPNTGEIWVYCVGKCKRGYSIYEYTARAGLSLAEFLKNDFQFQEAQPNEVRKMEWPAWFIPLFDRRAEKGREYLQKRGLEKSSSQFYYDLDTNGIVIPYYFHQTFVGAQIRFIEPKLDADGEPHKVDTLPGTRLGLVTALYPQTGLPDTIKGVVVCEGAFNATSLQQALDAVYGAKNPWKCIATSGCSVTDHHADLLREFIEQGKKIVLAYDFDIAGQKGIKRAVEKKCVTHVACTGDTEIDWNDALRALGEVGLAKHFLGSIKPV